MEEERPKDVEGAYTMNEKSGYSDEVFIELRIQLARIEAKLDDIPEIKESLKETSLKLERQSEKTDKSYSMSLGNREQIKELKSKQEWLSRAVIGAVITSIGTILIRLFMG